MRTALSALYRVAEFFGAVLFVLIALPILALVFARQFGVTVPAADEFAGYAMAGSFALMLGPSLRRGAHIRVGIIVDRLSGTPKRAMELLCLAFATALSGYFAFHWSRMTWQSYDFGDLSQGVIPIPLWIPQAIMAVGLVVLAVAFLDDLIAVASGRPATYETADAPSEG
ncbi:MAG TPA: TRAP transporter small permease [Azospirillum sp.]|nr:TRAP transporter small permease [Azospirillum sp.]